MRDLIIRPVSACLARRLTGLRADGGRGAIGVLVAVLIGSGVLFGMAALVVDVGQLYENRAELQNGADAAALAMAKSCAAGTCPSSNALAAQYADENASSLTSHTANVKFACGAAGANGTVSVGQGFCPVAATKNVCPANPPAGANYVDVETSTLLPNGSTVLPPALAGGLVGNARAGTVYACAQAEWGSPLTSTTLGFTISACTWDKATGVATGGQPTFAPPPTYTETDSATLALLKPLDQVVYAKGGPTGNGCSTEPNGAAAPGNFGWTADPNGNCTVLINAGTYGGSTGNSGAKDCQSLLSSWRTKQTVIDVPVYVSVVNPGNNATFTLKGFAAFVVTGYSLPGFNANDWVTGKAPCSGSAWCLSGFFTHDLVDTTGTLGGTSLGLAIIKLTG